MAQIIFNGKTINFNNAAPINSREGIAMYRTADRIYKILRNNPAAQNVEAGWRNAVNNYALPTAYRSIFPAIWQANDAPPNVAVLVIEMNILDITNFFQLSHGGEARLRNWINNEVIKERVRKIKNSLVAAKKCGLSDPQGVFQLSAGNPIVFIDVHTRLIENNDFDTLIELAENRLAGM